MGDENNVGLETAESTAPNPSAPNLDEIHVTIDTLVRSAQKLSHQMKERQRPWYAVLSDMRLALLKCLPCSNHPQPDVIKPLEKLVPIDQIYTDWIKPFNDLVDAEKLLPEITEKDAYKAASKKFRQQMLAVILHMAEGTWLNHCGLPKSNGLQIHIANAPSRGDDPVTQMRKKFRNEYYAKLDDGGMEADSDFYFEVFKQAAIHHEKNPSPAGRKRDRYDLWVEIGQHLQKLGSLDGCSIKRRGKWRSEKRGEVVEVYNVITPEKTFVLHNHGYLNRDRRRFEIFINTVHASKQYTMEQELRAMEKLKAMVTEEQYRQYFITGIITEVSKKSGVTYYVRKLKPTIAVRKKGRHFNFLAGLCLHPMAYYLDSFAGCLCPTDDVMSHLLWIRGDEHRFWSKANHHSQDQVEAGIP